MPRAKLAPAVPPKPEPAKASWWTQFVHPDSRATFYAEVQKRAAAVQNSQEGRKPLRKWSGADQ